MPKHTSFIKLSKLFIATLILGSHSINAQNLLISNDNDPPKIILQEEDGSDYFWVIEADDIEFVIRDSTFNNRSVVIENGADDNSIYIDDSGRIGFGTDQINGSTTDFSFDGGFSTHLLLTASSSHDWRLEADNYFSIENATNGDAPFFIQDDAPHLALGIEADGDVIIGGLSSTFDFEIIRGSTYSRINAGSSTFTTSSSRAFKENIFPVMDDQILDKVMGVPVNTYDWKRLHFNGEEKDRTNVLGLIAEDFHTILKRGDEKSINGQDVQMVLWLSVQKLIEENKKLKGQIESMISEKEDNNEEIRMIREQQKIMTSSFQKLSRRIQDITKK